MYIIIVGQGKVGSTLAAQLSEEGHELVLVDTDESVLTSLQETLDVATLCGNGAAADVLMEAGVAHATLLIACTDSDETNLLSCMLSRKLGCKHTIARVRNPEYEQNLRILKEDLQLSMAINPELTAAREIFRILQFPTFLKRQTFFRERAELVEMRVTEGSRLAGLKMMDFPKATGAKALICCVERKGTVHIPHGSFVLETGDRISIVSDANGLLRFCRDMNLPTGSAKSALIVGASRTAVHLSKLLLKNHVKITLIDQNQERCRQLTEELPEVTLVNGNGTKQDVLLSEGIRDNDAVLALTGFDEENLIISMFASYLGIKKTVTKINRAEYLDVYNTAGIDTIISPKLLTANAIIRYVRAMDNTSGNFMISLFRIMDEKAEAIEFRVPEMGSCVNRPFREMKILPNALVAAISRSGEVIIPSGSDRLQPGDNVIIIAARDANILSLNQVFGQ